MMRFSLTAQAIDTAALRARLASHSAGACATFEGWVRNHHEGRAVLGLRYEAYPRLALAEGERVMDEALARFAIIDACCVHRIGEVALGEVAVYVAAVAAHRDAAFAATRCIIDTIKARVPIWKHETYADGAAQWIHPPAP